MKTQKKILLLLLSVTLAMTLSGCTPPNYTRAKKKEVTKEHAAEAEAWFSAHMPEAKAEKGKAVADAVDLYAAITGTYKKDGKTYYYVYDYTGDRMYSDELFDEVSGLVTEKIREEASLSEETSVIHCLGHDFPLSYENDSWNERSIPCDEDGNPLKPEEITGSRREMMVPLDEAPESFAEKVLAGEVSFQVAADCYVEEFPEYDPAVFEKYDANFVGIWYYVPMDGNFSGIYKNVYTGRGTDPYTAEITNLGGGLYGGWTFHGVPDFAGEIGYEDLGKDGFSLTIPEKATPVLFSEKRKKKLQTYFTNSAGELVEYKLDELFRTSCPGKPDCYCLSTDFVTRAPLKYAYKAYRNGNGGGKYYFK